MDISMNQLEAIKIYAHHLLHLSLNAKLVNMGIVLIKQTTKLCAIQISIKACLNGYVDPKTNICVSNCGLGRYGNLTFGYKGMIEKTECLDCGSACFECSLEKECKSCMKGYYLILTEGKNTGTCFEKQGQLDHVIYVQSKDESGEVFQDGTFNYPFNSILYALSKAYKIGSSYESATIRIILFSNQTHSMVRYNSNLEEFEISDISQSTKIIIDTLDSVPTKVYFKLRDKFSFFVGAGLSINNIEFDAIDSILDVREGNINETLLELYEYQCLKSNTESCCQSEYQQTSQRYIINGPQICYVNQLPVSRDIQLHILKYKFMWKYNWLS
ncbi:UNKNOWN [Stylonychia lemnae]|uniref:Uncharacterized protein n=1 Tax=Stylonychia lemnae TaxID=5949 RepID=A0A078A0A8_STYLE|nr:UNKNOWN [Stylonychia lemnae]|eukprot:CDW74218.1 UNKNOWN [Stylonychia lemnae]